MDSDPAAHCASPERTLYATPSPGGPRSPQPSTPMATTAALGSPGVTSTTSAPSFFQASYSHTSTSGFASPPSADDLPPDMPSPGSPAGPPSAADSSPDEGSGSDPDPQIIEALRSKDRLWVLKLGEMMEGLITERRVRIDLSPATTYQRMLVHRCSAYYKLSPESDSASKSILVYYRADSRIPPRRISDLVPPEESAQPAFKIMRRNIQSRPRVRQDSQPGSVTGDDADLSDIEPSETGSVGGRSSTTGTSSRRHMTIEEREAAYQEARLRIFMDFNEKKEDMSANSSTLSLVSGSGSTSGGRRSSIGEADDSASSAAPTESERSGPVHRDKRDTRRGGSAASSSRSLRSSSYNANGSGSSRNSRAASPSSFTYATLYEPSTVDAAPYPQVPHGYVFYPQYTSGQIPGPPYLSPYPYYPPYGYAPPPTLPSEPQSSTANESMYPPHHPSQAHMNYNNQYLWQQPPPPSGQSQAQQAYMPHMSANGQSNVPAHSQAPQGPSGQAPQAYAGYMPPPPLPPQYPYTQGYPHPPYVYPPGPSMSMPPGPMAQQAMYSPDMARSASEMGHMGYGNGNGADGSNSHSRASSRSSGSHHGGPGTIGSKRNAPRARGAWSFGPGAGMGGYTYNLPSAAPPGGPEAIGPRFNSNIRRISGASSTSGSAGTRTPGDEASSTASSSETSSSSRGTFTSTSTTSKHPLPARPDWAVGLKAQPGLHPPRHHEHSGPNSRTMSPARLGGQAQPTLQPTDFPPLSSAAERRTPVVGGAWTNASSMRSIMQPGPASASALVHYPNSQPPGNGARLEDEDAGYERPPPKGAAELFNPKGAGRAAEARVAGLAEKMGAMGVREVEGTPVGSPNHLPGATEGLGEGGAAAAAASS